MDNMDM